MIIGTDRLAGLRGRVSMVDGGFDPIHAGHVAYFRAAAELGLPVLCNVAGDAWVMRKHAPLLPQAERAAVIDAFRWIDWTHPAPGPTVDVLRAARPRYYVKGRDWEGRFPAEERAACEELGIEPVFLDTVTHSSTEILRRYGETRANGG